MMKIEKKVGKRILINGKELRLDTYCNNDNMWFWYIYTKEEVDSRLFSKSGEYFKLFLKMDQKYPYSAYEGRMYCIYLGYKYEVENIWHGLFILSPNERKTRRHLKLYVVKQKCTTANIVIYSNISLFYYHKFFC